jgi:hypothetical protein
LVLLGQRYYDPTQGRFLNRDPLGYGGGMNLYAYCGDDPVNEVRYRQVNQAACPSPAARTVKPSCRFLGGDTNKQEAEGGDERHSDGYLHKGKDPSAS